jgi:hypothetical protein
LRGRLPRRHSRSHSRAQTHGIVPRLPYALSLRMRLATAAAHTLYHFTLNAHLSRSSSVQSGGRTPSVDLRFRSAGACHTKGFARSRRGNLTLKIAPGALVTCIVPRDCGTRISTIPASKALACVRRHAAPVILNDKLAVRAINHVQAHEHLPARATPKACFAALTSSFAKTPMVVAVSRSGSIGSTSALTVTAPAHHFLHVRARAGMQVDR